MLSFARRLSAALIVLALSAGNVTVCAGWMPTPEARMACCTKDGSCPMRQAHVDHRESGRVLTQAEADGCCASSEQDDSAPSLSVVSLAASLGIVLSPLPAPIPEAGSRAQVRRASVPLPASRVPKHLLLSVFLV